MRLFEILYLVVLLTGLLLVGILEPSTDRPMLLKTVANILPLAALLFLLHAVVERVRWQLGPAYLSLAILGIAVLCSVSGNRAGTVAAATLGIAGVLAACLFCWLLPMFRFAPLTGPHRTGTTIVMMTDRSREDASPSGYRELMVQLWYPAEKSRNALASYRRLSETTKISSYQSVLKTRSRMDALLPGSDTKLPLLLFNPAWNGRRTQNTFLVEELASYGFVVAAVDHTHNSEPVAFPDGRVVMAQHEHAMEDVSSSTADEVQRIGNSEVERQVLDCRFVIDELTLWNEDEHSKWFQRLDLERVGTFGHSLGGATSIECWATDARVKAAMNMDGWTFGHQAATGRRAVFAHADETRAPLLFIYEGNYDPFPVESIRKSSGKSEVEQAVDDWDAAHVRDLLQHHGGYWLKLLGANHVNFTDRTISSPLRRLAGGGEIDPRRAHSILRDYAVSFFSQALLGTPSELLAEGSRAYSEIVVRPVKSDTVSTGEGTLP